MYFQVVTVKIRPVFLDAINRRHMILIFFFQIQAEWWISTSKKGHYKYLIRKMLEIYIQFLIKNLIPKLILTTIFFIKAEAEVGNQRK